MKRAFKWCLWITSIPCVLMIAEVPENPLYLIPVIGGFVWMIGSTVATFIEESK